MVYVLLRCLVIFAILNMKTIITLSLSIALFCTSLTSFSQTLDPAASPTGMDGDKLFTAVEIQPTFRGGAQAFSNFLRNNINYPATAKQQKIQGRVFARFVVEKDGSLTDIEIMREPGGGLGDEATRVLKLSPKWIPGIQNGRPVRVMFTVPMNFSLGTPNLNEPPSEMALHPMPSADTAGGKTFSAVEVAPAFPGGEAAFAKFLGDNVVYPKSAKKKNVTGRVFVQFIVERDGSLTDFRILRDPGEGLGDEAIRVLKLSPKWQPGVQNSKPVRVQFTVPINFALN